MAIYMNGTINIDEIQNIDSKSDENRQIHKTRLMYIVLGHIAYYSVIVFAFLLVLKMLGIEATSIIALLGATGFTIGLALQGTLSDISSGILLGILQTYTIGDLIEIDGHIGRVRDFNMTSTIISELHTHATIIIPNRKISGNTIINHTKLPQRAVMFEIRISNSYKNFDELIVKLQNDIAKYPGVKSTPYPPVVGVNEMKDVGTILIVKFSINTKDYPDIVIPIKSHVRQFLANNEIPLVDPF